MNALLPIFKNQIMLGLLLAVCFFVPWKKRRSLFPLRLGAAAAGALCLSEFAPVPAPYVLLLFFAVIGLTVWFCFNCNVKYALFVSTCAYCVQHITSKLAFLVQRLWLTAAYGFVRFNFMPLTMLLLLLANVLVCVPLYFLATRRVLGGEFRFDSARIFIATSSFLVAAVFLSYYLELSLDFDAEAYIVNYCCLNAFCILFAFLVLLMNFMNVSGKKLEAEKSTLEQLIKKDKLQYEQAKRNMERINIRYHDLKQQYLAGADAGETARLEREMDNFKTLYYTGNKAVDITLSEKAAACADAGVQFVCSADGGCLDMMKPYHIYSLLGNAIDNAMECLATVADAEKKVLRLDVCRRGDMSVICIENYIPYKLTLKNGLPVTTKKDRENHGFGMKSIKNVVEEYGGLLYIDAEDSVFRLTAMIPGRGEKAAHMTLL